MISTSNTDNLFPYEVSVFGYISVDDDSIARLNERDYYLPISAQRLIIAIADEFVTWKGNAKLLYSYIATQFDNDEDIKRFTKIEISPNILKHCDFLFTPDVNNPEIINARYRIYEPLQIKITSFERYPLVPLDPVLMKR